MLNEYVGRDSKKLFRYKYLEVVLEIMVDFITHALRFMRIKSIPRDMI
jgi:hypothetical protein